MKTIPQNSPVFIVNVPHGDTHEAFFTSFLIMPTLSTLGKQYSLKQNEIFLIFVLWCFQDMLTDLFRNIDRFRDDLRNTVGMSTESIDALLEMPLPENRMQASFL